MQSCTNKKREAALAGSFPLTLCNYQLQQAAVQLLDFLHVGVAGVAGAAGVCKGGLGQELDVLLLQDALQVGGDANIGRELLDGGNRCIGGLDIVHLVNAGNAHSLADCAVTLACNGLVVLQTGGQDDGAGNAMGGVIQGGQAVCHAVNNA